MYLRSKKIKTEYQRTSKTGKKHTYFRIKTLALFQCDSCETEFTRDLKHISKKRLSNNYFHVCSNCDAKRFAQKKGVERKQVWNMPASSDMPISKL
jgi:hypothetical protein